MAFSGRMEDAQNVLNVPLDGKSRQSLLGLFGPKDTNFRCRTSGTVNCMQIAELAVAAIDYLRMSSGVFVLKLMPPGRSGWFEHQSKPNETMACFTSHPIHSQLEIQFERHFHFIICNFDAKPFIVEWKFHAGGDALGFSAVNI